MTAARRRPMATALCAAVLFQLCSLASAHEAVVIGAQRKLPTYGWETPHGSLDFIAQYSRDSGSSDSAEDSESTEYRFDESLTLRTRGYIVHPNLVDLSLGGQFGLTQDFFETAGQNDHVYTTLYLWDLQAVFFREQATSLALYTSRTEGYIDRAFGETLRNTYTTYGGLVATRFKDLPTTFRLYRTEQTQSSLGGTEDFSLTENVFEWHSEARPTPNQYLTLDYRANQTDQDSAGTASTSTTGQSASIAHSLSFGPANRHTLNSTAIYSDSTGDFGLEQLHIDELMRLRHSQTFETEYEYIYDKRTSDTIDQTQQFATAEFRHWLYQSLVSHGELGYLTLDVADGETTTTQWFGELDFQYTKKVPKGNLEATLDLGYTVRETDDRSEPVPVVDQPFTFIGVQPILIPGQTVEEDSITISDAAGRIFSEGPDYTLTQQPNGVRVDRVIGGAIPSDSVVLIDYLFGPTPAFQVTTNALAISLRYNILEGKLSGLSPYVRYALIDQNVSGGGGIIQPDSVRDYLVGLEYRRWDLTLRGEYEYYDSTLVPYDAYRLFARYDHRVSGDTIINGNASYVYTNYTDLDRQTTTINGDLAVTRQLTQRLVGTFGLNWVLADDSDAGRTTGLQEFIELRWRNRQLEVYGRARNSNLNSDSSDSNFQFVEIGIRREF